MTKPNFLFKDLNQLPTGNNVPGEDENQLKNNGNRKNKQAEIKDSLKKMHIDPSQEKVTPLRIFGGASTSYKESTKKWQILTDFFKLASRSHQVHLLKFQTMFLSYSLADKTVELVLNNTLEFEDWVVCCLFMSMKYEEIYYPRFKDLQMLVKKPIEPSEYNKAELKMMEFINLNMNFESLNTYMSEYLHACNEEQRHFIFYFLETGLSLKKIISRFTQKEIVLSIIFIFSSHRFYVESNQKIDGIPFDRIEECSKILIINQHSGLDKLHAVHKKYKQERMHRVSLQSIPKIENLTTLLVKKTDIISIAPRIVGFCEDMTDENMDCEYQHDKEELLRILISRQKYRTSAEKLLMSH